MFETLLTASGLYHLFPCLYNVWWDVSFPCLYNVCCTMFAVHRTLISWHLMVTVLAEM